MTHQRKGIILAGGSGTRLYPLTLGVSKQMMPVYDKPMIYYPLSCLMRAEIRDILIIATPHDLPLFQTLLGDGAQWGLTFSYREQPSPDGLAQAFIIGETFLDHSSVMLVLGDNLFYGHDLTSRLREAARQTEGATIFSYPVNNPQDYGVVSFDSNGKAFALEEKPTKPQSAYAVPGIYYYDAEVCQWARTLKPSARGELEITDLNRLYMEQGKLNVQRLGRGTAWLDTGSPDALLDAAVFVRVIEKRQGLKVSCVEEIAWSQGWIDDEQLLRCAETMPKTDYSAYLRQLLKPHHFIA